MPRVSRFGGRVNGRGICYHVFIMETQLAAEVPQSRKPFAGEFEIPVVPTRERTRIQLVLIKRSGIEDTQWVEEYGDLVSELFVKDAELVTDVLKDPLGAAQTLGEKLYKIKPLGSIRKAA